MTFKTHMNPLTRIDAFLNKTTMYRLVLYILLCLYGVSLVFGVFGLISFSVISLISTSIIILLLCISFNRLFAHHFAVPTNADSVYITAFLIYFLLLPPDGDWSRFVVEVLIVTTVAIGSKYLIVKEKKHIFNPTALGFVASALILGVSASWWVSGDWRLTVLLIAGGILIVRKLRHSDLFFAFLATYLLITLLVPIFQNGVFDFTFLKHLILSPLSFFAFFMLTEPLTTPPGRRLRIVYGAIAGALYGGSMYAGSLFASPEVVLVLANLFSFAFSPKYRLVLRLIGKRVLA
ncbi:MAG: RnfABCDGE type electron transport complex subunit D, partial [Patescibacteria group bacterium]